MNLLKRLRYLWKAPDALDALIAAEQKKRELERIEADKDRLHLCHRHRQEEKHAHRGLHLCYRHRQEEKQAHYDEKNCDYCNLERERDFYKHHYEKTE